MRCISAFCALLRVELSAWRKRISEARQASACISLAVSNNVALASRVRTYVLIYAIHLNRAVTHS